MSLRDTHEPMGEDAVIEYQGIFRRQLTTWQATALIVSATVGAGILAIPYAIAKVGMGIGLVYLVVLGTLMICMNLLIGEVAVRTGEQMQLVGLAKKYLGRSGGWCMTVLVYATTLGVLTVYIIGCGNGLGALFGGSAFVWSLAFAVVGTVLIFIGMRTVKTVEFILTFGILLVVLSITFFGAPHIAYTNFQSIDLAHVFFPYGVILFAYHSATSIPEAHTLLKNKETQFKKAIITSGVIAMVVYILFALVVVGVSGPNTTEIATIGLGQRLGQAVFLLGNIFAILAMSTSFLIVGLAMRDSLRWDYALPTPLSTLLVCGIPIALFLLGLRGFVALIGLIGGVCISLEMILLVFIYWRARERGDVSPGSYHIHHALFIVVALLFALTVGAVYSVLTIFPS